MYLFVFEFLGTTELIVILVVALVLFGPRKLPELGRTLGKSLAEFKRATDDFKRTWEREVELDKIEREMRIEQEISSTAPALPEENPARTAEASGDGAMMTATNEASAADETGEAERTIARRPSPTPAATSPVVATADAPQASGE